MTGDSGVLDPLSRVDEFLRATGAFAPLTPHRPWWWTFAIIVSFAPLYGAVMGSFACDSAERLLQVVYSAVKAPLLLLATMLVCLPAFFVLNTIAGVRDDFGAVIQAVVSGQAAMSIALAALAPLTVVWYASEESYRMALLFNAAMFSLGACAGQIVIRREYRPLIRRNRRHRTLLAGWLTIYVFVGIQMGWMLRPFVGSPGARVTFFREEPFSNAYVVVFELITGARDGR